MQRHRERQRFGGMVERFGCNQLYRDVLEAILPAWAGLVSGKNCPPKSAKNCPPLMGVNGYDFTVKIKGENVTLTADSFLHKPGIEIAPTQGGESGHEISKKEVSIFCRICGADITTQRAGSSVCSRLTLKAHGRRCKSDLETKQKSKRRQLAREQETRQLETFLSSKEGEGLAFRLEVILSTGEVWSGTAREAGKANGLKVQSAVRVEVSTRKASFLLTTQRAKALIRIVREGQAKRSRKRKLKTN
jgi:hypothetical protein